TNCTRWENAGACACRGRHARRRRSAATKTELWGGPPGPRGTPPSRLRNQGIRISQNIRGRRGRRPRTWGSAPPKLLMAAPERISCERRGCLRGRRVSTSCHNPAVFKADAAIGGHEQPAALRGGHPVAGIVRRLLDAQHLEPRGAGGAPPLAPAPAAEDA